MIDILTSFIVSIGADLTAYWICKWLDRHESKLKDEPPGKPESADSDN